MRKNRTKTRLRSCLLSGMVDRARKEIMNLEQRSKLYHLINMTQGLLAWAIKTGDKAEEERLRRELATLVEQSE